MGGGLFTATRRSQDQPIYASHEWLGATAAVARERSDTKTRTSQPQKGKMQEDARSPKIPRKPAEEPSKGHETRAKWRFANNGS